MTNENGGLRRAGAVHFGRTIGATVLAALFAVGCGSGDGDEEPAAARKKDVAPADAATSPAKTGASGTTVKTADPKPHMATAVADAKTTAPVDLLYDIPAKPEVGQAFTVELAVTPRVPADTLDVEVIDSQGLTFQGERVARFPAVEAGQPYSFKVQVVGDAAGMYYVGVMAKVSTKVQSEARAFSVPVVIGTPAAAAQKPAPQKDATGQAIESMPAKEN